MEIFVAMTIMFATVATVVSFEQDHSSIPPLERLLTTKAQDSVDVWREWLLPSTGLCAPSTKLEQLIRDGLKEDHSTWNTMIDAKFGPAYDVDLVLDNYDSILPLHGTGRVVGNTGITNWAPDQTYALPFAAVNSASGTERIRVDSPAVQFGALARGKGDAARFSVEFDTATAAQAHRTAWGLTGLFTDSTDDRGRSSASSVQWHGPSGPKLEFGLDPKQVALPPGQDSIPLSLKLVPARTPSGSDGTIPMGTLINVTFPAGWHDVMWVVDDLLPWVDISPPATSDRLHLAARLDAASPSDTLNLIAYAPPSPVRPFDVITARLSHGSLAESNLVVTYPITSTDRSTPRVLAPTTPYAMRAGDTALFGAALANGGDAITITNFSITIPGGYDLLHNNANGAPLFRPFGPGVADPPVPSTPDSFPISGWKWVSPRTLVWESSDTVPAITVQPLKAAQFWIKAPITTDPAHGTALETPHYDGPNTTIEFTNGYKVASRSWGKSPGIVSVLVPPATRADNDPLGPTADGYPWSADSILLGQERFYDTTGRSTIATVGGHGNYTLRPGASDAVNFENAAANASFEVMTRKVPVGTRMRADGDLSSLLAKLEQLGLPSELRLDLYSPPSLGCEPTATWSIETENLPTPAILHTMIWDAGEATPSVFATTGDGYLYRLGETGSPVWARKLDGKATSLEQMDRGAAGKYLLVGTSQGKVQAIDAIDGDLAWPPAIVDADVATQTSPMVAVAFDAANDRVVAAGGKRTVVLRASDGSLIASAISGGSPVDVVVAAEGIFVRNSIGGWHRLSPTLDIQLAGTGAETGMLVANGRIIVSGSLEARVFDATTGSMLATIPYAREAVRTARGEATRDGVPDLAVLFNEYTLKVISGATATVEWTGEQLYSIAPSPEIDPFRYQDPTMPMPGVDSCTPLSSPATFATPYACGEADIGSELGGLAAGVGKVAIAKRTFTDALISRQPKDLGQISAWDDLRAGETPRSVSLGPWLTNSHALAYGNTNGLVALYSDIYPPTTIFESEPIDRAGRFSFYMNVPEGGFYGTHLVVARLMWTQAGVHQEARLMDWFEVVAKDGSPVLNPAYRVALTLDPREETS